MTSWPESDLSVAIKNVRCKEQEFKPGKFIRKGKVGGDKGLMSAEQERCILDKAEEMPEPARLNFLELVRQY